MFVQKLQVEFRYTLPYLILVPTCTVTLEHVCWGYVMHLLDYIWYLEPATIIVDNIIDVSTIIMLL